MFDIATRHGFGTVIIGACVALSSLASLGALVLASRSVWRSPAIEESVTAKAFVLVDDKGKVRARLGVNPENRNSGLFLFDSAGHKLAEFDVDQDKSAELTIYGADESTKIGLMLGGEHERPLINLYSEAEHHSSYPAVTLGVWEPGSQPSAIQRKCEGHGVLRVYDADGAETLREGK